MELVGLGKEARIGCCLLPRRALTLLAKATFQLVHGQLDMADLAHGGTIGQADSLLLGWFVAHRGISATS